MDNGAASAMQLSGYSGQGRPAEAVPDAGPAQPDPAPMLPPRSPGPAETDALPADSGSGKRVVFDIGAQRVWLVGADDRVARTYLVSGSVTDNLEPGSYEVYSTSRHAVGIDESGTMQYMVRFAHGKRAAIGFHDIPVDKGRQLQSRAALGTPQSHGCIRQARPDARALWDFAGVGTTVVVTA
jgi:lipoprotein-anchoring transpeptidase ErfK/SrfK